MTHRILHIIPSLDRAGAEKQLVLLAQGLPKDLFDVHVCALTRGGPLLADLQAAQLPVKQIGKRLKFDPMAFWQLQRWIRALRPQLVHTWLFAANAYGRAAARAAGVPHIVASERCVDRWKAGYQLVIDRILGRSTDRIVVNSPGVRQFYVDRSLPAEKFVVIPGGVAAAEAVRSSRAALLAELQFPPTARLIGAVGRLWPQKRVQDLIWAADLMHLVDDQARLVVIGDGPQRSQLERFVRLIRADEHVRILGHRDDVPSILPHLDVLWLGSEYEGLPNAIMEAMAAAVPVVATDIPGNRDLVVPNETGFLVPVGGRAEYARATDKIFRDPKLARRLGDAARQRVSTHFGVEQMVERHVEMYLDVLEGSN